MSCSNCNRPVSEQDRFCKHCGAPIKTRVVTTPLQEDISPSSNVNIVKSKVSSSIRTDVRYFNRNIFDRSDPLDYEGSVLNDFSLAVSYPVKKIEHEDIIRLLYSRVVTKVQQGAIPDAQIKLVDFNDAKTGSREKPRQYIEIKRETHRKTQMSTYVTFASYGDYIYTSVDSLILGPINVWAAILAPFAFIVFVLFLLFSLQWCFIPIAIVLVTWVCGSMLYELIQGESIGVIFRRRFHKDNNLGSFNVDDILMFFKSANPLVLQTIQEVFAEHNIPTDTIDDSLRRISMTTNVSASGGIINIIGSTLSSVGSRITGRG